MSGCCVDKSCTSETCMKLPPGTTCAACAYVKHCVALYGIKPEDTQCDFFPRRFRLAQVTTW